eukprot:2811184-Amphidinium_carterae.2
MGMLICDWMVDACNPSIFEASSRVSALNVELRWLRRAPMFMSCLCDIPQGSSCCIYVRVAPPVASRKKHSLIGAEIVQSKRART